MNVFVSRLIRCGMPRSVAVAVCNYYRRRGETDDLERYVEAVEKENGEMEDIFE